MRHIYILTMISAMLSVSSVCAQENSARKEPPCVIEPIFHCVQLMEEGGAIGHFGYDMQCPDDVPASAELYVDINDKNLFSPDPKDRGQPKVFLSGEHVDEFEADFSKAEVKTGSVIHWTVLGQTALVDFSKTKDESLDCSTLSQ